jgi:hypothetical protein
LRRSPRTSSQRNRKQLNFLLRVVMNQATFNIAVVNIATTIKATDATMMIADLTIVIKTIDTTIALDAMTRTQRAPSPMTRRVIAGAITSRKRATRPCIMTSLLCQAPAICLEEGVNLVPDLLCSLALAQAAGATTTIMSTKMIASRVQPPSTGIHPSTCICTPRTTMTEITIAQTKSHTVFATFFAPKARKKRIQK